MSRKNISNKLIFKTERNGRTLLVGRKRSCLKESGVTTQGRREVEVGTLLLGNGKNNVTANKKYFFYF